MAKSSSTRELYLLCDTVIKGGITIDDALTKIRDKITEHGDSLVSQLFDTVTAFSNLPLNPERKENATKFFKAVSDEFLPKETLSVELPQLGADQLKSKVIKTKTKTYYKQLKFNLFREESEGYSKLAVELLSISSKDDVNTVFNQVSNLIGQFNLDPNRTVDLLLDCFGCNFEAHRIFIDLLKLLNIETDVLKRIILLKLILFKKTGRTPNFAYRVIAMLSVVKMVNIDEIFKAISPTREEFSKELAKQRKILSQRISKAQTISTLATIQSEESRSNGVGSAINEGLSYASSSSSNVQSARSFSSVTKAQEIEDQKVAGNSFDEYLILGTNQKLGILVAAAEIGALGLVQQLVLKFPENFPLGTSKRLALALCQMLEYIIDPFYNLKYQLLWSKELNDIKTYDSFFVEKPERLSKWDDLPTRVVPLLKILGPYLGTNREVGMKLMKLLNVFFKDEKAQAADNRQEITDLIFSIVDFCLLPSLCIGETSFSYNEELWTILNRVPYQGRYWMYGRWKGVHSAKNYELQLQRGKVIGQMKYIMKRMTKETVKVAGRQLGKVCLKHPTIAFDYMLDRVQSFQNLIGPVVESMRYLSDLSFDVLTYSLIEALSNPSKQGLKTGDGTLSSWLIALATFAGAVYRRYNVEYEGILQYVTNQLKDRKSLDLMILREVITSTAGFEPTNSLTEDQLNALCSGIALRQEVIGNANQRGRRQAISRLRDALLHTDLCESLAILLAQQKNCVIYNETKNAPVKLTSQMVDQCQETFLQFANFLRFNIKPEEYTKRIPTLESLFTEYNLSSEVSFFLARPNYTTKALSLYDLLKKLQKESADIKKLDTSMKNDLYIDAWSQVLKSVEEELLQSLPETRWNALSAKVYTYFWLLSISDIHVSTGLYNREIERARKELSDLPKADISKSRKAKEEERLKALEQKLVQEFSRQEEHVSRIRMLIEKAKDEFFAKQSSASNSQVIKFIQHCLFPRCIFSEVDAVYCAKFVYLLHSIRTEYFSTIILLDNIFSNIAQVLTSMSENEASAFGKFISLLLETVLKWHSKKEIFVAECEDYPGCLAKLRNSSGSFAYEDFRTACFKWQIRLNRTLVQALSDKNNYTLVRNAFLILNKLLYQFPIITTHVTNIERAAIAVRDREKEKRMDLSVMAQSYLVHLKKRNVKTFDPTKFDSATTPTKIPTKTS